METKPCIKCGQPLGKVDDRFCEACGTEQFSLDLPETLLPTPASDQVISGKDSDAFRKRGLLSSINDIANLAFSPYDSAPLLRKVSLKTCIAVTAIAFAFLYGQSLADEVHPGWLGWIGGVICGLIWAFIIMLSLTSLVFVAGWVLGIRGETRIFYRASYMATVGIILTVLLALAFNLVIPWSDHEGLLVLGLGFSALLFGIFIRQTFRAPAITIFIVSLLFYTGIALIWSITVTVASSWLTTALKHITSVF